MKPSRLSAMAALSALSLSMAGNLPADTFTWTGGGGDAKWTTAGNWAEGQPPFDGTDAIRFNGPFTSGTTTSLDGNKTIDRLTFNTTTAFTINNNTLTVQSGLITRNDVSGTEGNHTINSAILLGADGVIDSRSIDNTFTVGAIGDGGQGRSLLIQGSKEVTCNSALSYTGATLLNGAGLTLGSTSANGVARNSTAWTLVRATLSLGASGNHVLDDGTTTFGRLGNTAPVTMYGGTFKLTGKTDDSTTERYGELRLTSGYCTVHASRSGTGTAALLGTRLVRGEFRPMAYILASGTVNIVNVADADSVPLIGGDGSRTVNKPVVPFARALSGSNVFVTYGGTSGFRPLSTSTDFVASLAAADADGTDNVRYDFTAATTQTLTADKAVNSLIADCTSSTQYTLTVAGTAGTKLTVASGAIMLTGNNNAGLSLTVPTLDFGNAEAVLTTTGSGGAGMPISSAILGTGGITVYGGGTGVDLKGNNDGLSGPFTVNAGTLSVSTTRQALPVATPVILGGGIFRTNLGVSSGLAMACASVRGRGTLALNSNTAALNIGANTGGANGYVTLAANGILAPGDSPAFPGSEQLVGTVTIRNVQGNYDTQHAGLALKGGQLQMDIAGRSAFDKINFSTQNSGASGILAFGSPGSSLALALGYAPAVGDTFMIIDVKGTVPTTGSFANGAAVDAEFGGNVYTFDILYNSSLGGGDGNDVVLRVASIASAAPAGSVLLLR